MSGGGYDTLLHHLPSLTSEEQEAVQEIVGSEVEFTALIREINNDTVARHRANTKESRQ